MSRFIETIQIKDGKAQNLDFHIERFNRTRMEHYGKLSSIDLGFYLPELALDNKEKTFKWRIEYDREIKRNEIIEYQPTPVKSLKIVIDDTIKYSYKYTDRSHLETLFNRRGKYDNIIIIKNGLVSDSYYANLAFLEGDKWYTPSTPLLQGTKRARLLLENKLVEKEIRQKDIGIYSHVCLINAMLDPGECQLETTKIYT